MLAQFVRILTGNVVESGHAGIKGAIAAKYFLRPETNNCLEQQVCE